MISSCGARKLWDFEQHTCRGHKQYIMQPLKGCNGAVMIMRTHAVWEEGERERKREKERDYNSHNIDMNSTK